MIGAHDGKKTEHFVKKASEYGKVCLVEPVPHLFSKLKKRHSNSKRVTLINKCVTSDQAGMIQFYAPKPHANSIQANADQLGSLNDRHAINHNEELDMRIN